MKKFSLVTCAFVLSLGAAALADSPARSERLVRADYSRATADLKKFLPNIADILDPAKRKALDAKVIPTLKSIATLADEMISTKPQFTGEYYNEIIRCQSALLVLDDADTAKEVKAATAAPDKSAFNAKLTLRLANYWKSTTNAAAQQQILGEIKAIAVAAPADGQVYFVLMTMKDIGAASPDIADKAEEIVAENLKGDDPEFVKKVHDGHVKQKANMNKPVEFAGKTVDGKDFSTTSYKGKVVLIDFWATWCHPCVEENPRIKTLYAKYHDKGLEIVGISCDNTGEKLSEYVAKEKIDWVQMWDKKLQTEIEDDAWHPIAKAWGVMSIPQMFLIDRAGNLRTVDARENMEEMIPKLLDEKTK